MTLSLQLRSVSHSFQGVPVLDDVSLGVAPGEIVSIVGPSGCGKSTLLRIAAGLLDPTAGSVSSDNQTIGFVFQDPALLPWRRVQDNARLLAAQDDYDFVDALLHTAGLASHRNKWPHQLSGGMKMRLSLVRTLAMRPTVILADEPFGALDQLTRQHLHDELLSLHAAAPFSLVMVTHAIDEAVYLADRIITMSGASQGFVAETRSTLPRPRTAMLRYEPVFGEICGRVATTLQADTTSLRDTAWTRDER